MIKKVRTWRRKKELYDDLVRILNREEKRGTISRDANQHTRKLNGQGGIEMIF